LRQPSGRVMPYILEEEVSATGLRNVTVIWDRWKGIREENRSDVILAAYEAAEGKEYADSVASAIGVTPTEAVALGYLSYLAEPLRRNDDPITEADYRRAFAEEATRTLLGKSAKELRYPRVEEANEAYDRLMAALPGSHWGA